MWAGKHLNLPALLTKLPDMFGQTHLGMTASCFPFGKVRNVRAGNTVRLQ